MRLACGYPRVRFYPATFAHGAAGVAARPAFPAPSALPRDNVDASPGRSASRERERMPARGLLPAPASPPHDGHAGAQFGHAIAQFATSAFTITGLVGVVESVE